MLRRKPRSLRAMLSLVLAPLLACGVLTATLVAGPASPASAASKITICLKNSTSFCVDVKDSNDVAGQPVWLYSASGAKDYHWLEVPIPCADPGCIPNCVVANACVAFEDAQNTSLCLAAAPNQGMDLISCGLGINQGGTPRAAWLYQGTNLRNIFFSTDYLTVFGPLANKNPLYVAALNGASGEWQKWIGPVAGG